MSSADRQPVFPPSAKPAGPYMPGLLVGNYLYVSGQGARGEDNRLAEGFDNQLAQTLRNVETIVEAGGMTMKDIVHGTVYLSDLSKADRFTHMFPAMVVFSVARMPGDTPIEITVVARKGPEDRRFLPGVYAESVDQLQKQVEAEGPQSLASLTVYHAREIPHEDIAGALAETRAAVNIVQVEGLANGAPIGFTGISALDESALRPHGPRCVSLGDTVYVAVQTPSNPNATIAEQTEDAIAQAGRLLSAAGSSLADAIVCNVYLDDIEDFAAMNAAYKAAFPEPPPTRTTVQPAKSGGVSKMRISVVARRPR